MRFKMIISRALFVFSGIKNGKAQMESVHFLSDDKLEQHNNLLVVKNDQSVDFFLSGTEPLAKMSIEQVGCLVAAARYFGYLPGCREKIPMWFCTDSIAMERQENVPLAA